MKILKVLRRNSNKAIAILLCFTLIFSNSLVTLAETNFDDPNTETSESIVEDIEEELVDMPEEESLDNESFNEENVEVEEEIDEPENDEEFNSSLGFEEEPEEDIDDIDEEVENESENNIDEENAGENEENDSQQLGEETGELIDETEESTNEDTNEENSEEELEELGDLNPALLGAPIFQAPPMLGDAGDGVYLISPPTKTIYTPGETIDYTGLTIKEVFYGTENIYTYPDGSSYFEFETTEAQTNEGTQTIDFVFDNYERGDLSFDITVTAAVTGIAVDTAPTKTTYNVGESFDSAGLQIRIYKSNGTNEVVAYSSSVFSYSPTTALTTTNTSITITHTASGKTCTQAITVTAQVTSIEIVTPPTKVSYNVGETFNPSGLQIKLNKSDSTSETVAYSNSLFSFSPSGTLGTSDTTITITHTASSKTCTQTITVTNAPPTPPTPPAPTPSPSHGGGSSGGGGGGAGRPVYDNSGNILHPGSEPNIKGTTKVLTGQKQIITISSNNQMVDWNKNLRASEVKPIIFVNETKKFLDTSTNRTITNDWVGVVNQNGNINWYYTNNDGSLIQSQLFQVGDGVFCFGDDGVMLTGNVQIGNEVYYFNESKGAGEGALVRKEPVSI